MRVNKVQTDPDKPESIAEQQKEMMQVVDGLIEFGEPLDPFDPKNTGLAGAAAASHPGTTSNIAGSWVEIILTTSGRSEKECHHNLYLNDGSAYTLPTSGEPNVRWLLFGALHDGTNKDGTETLACNVAFAGGTVTVNSVKLLFNAVTGGTAVTIDSNHPVLCTLFFTRATRM